MRKESGTGCGAEPEVFADAYMYLCMLTFVVPSEFPPGSQAEVLQVPPSDGRGDGSPAHSPDLLLGQLAQLSRNGSEQRAVLGQLLNQIRGGNHDGYCDWTMATPECGFVLRNKALMLIFTRDHCTVSMVLLLANVSWREGHEAGKSAPNTALYGEREREEPAAQTSRAASFCTWRKHVRAHGAILVTSL